ncbi:hypothetical protein Tco_1289917 [Tanacetum coccineum]
MITTVLLATKESNIRLPISILGWWIWCFVGYYFSCDSIVPAGFFVLAGRYGYAAGRFISADRVFVPAVYMVSAVSIQSCWWNNVSAT